MRRTQLMNLLQLRICTGKRSVLRKETTISSEKRRRKPAFREGDCEFKAKTKKKTRIVNLFELLIVQIERVLVLHDRSIDGAAATIDSNRYSNPFRETIIITSLANMSCFFVLSSTRLIGRAYDDFYASPNHSKPTNIPSVKIPQYL